FSGLEEHRIRPAPPWQGPKAQGRSCECVAAPSRWRHHLLRRTRWRNGLRLLLPMEESQDRHPLAGQTAFALSICTSPGSGPGWQWKGEIGSPTCEYTANVAALLFLTALLALFARKYSGFVYL